MKNIIQETNSMRDICSLLSLPFSFNSFFTLGMTVQQPKKQKKTTDG